MLAYSIVTISLLFLVAAFLVWQAAACHKNGILVVLLLLPLVVTWICIGMSIGGIIIPLGLGIVSITLIAIVANGTYVENILNAIAEYYLSKVEGKRITVDNSMSREEMRLEYGEHERCVSCGDYLVNHGRIGCHIIEII